MERILTLAYSSHRLETLPWARKWMIRHEAIFLEEPPLPGFVEMLEGGLPVNEYLLAADFEYLEFARAASLLHQTLHRQGKVIIQADPYLEVLFEIQSFFAQGGTPEQIRPNTLRQKVYSVEKIWTGALVHFYRISQQGSFGEVVRAVQDFARQDAARGRIRDSLRAQAIVHHLSEFTKAYVESGYIHFWLKKELKKRLPEGWELQVVFLLEEVVRQLADRTQILAPGDLLTLVFTNCPSCQGKRIDLLAARSLIYSRIIGKEELSGNDYPHTRNEMWACSLVNRLSYDQCRLLYGRIARSDTSQAGELVQTFLTGRERRTP